MCDTSYLSMNTQQGQSDFYRFSCQAMATTFEIYIAQASEYYAQNAAHSAFNLLNNLHNQLSRFIENSDITRLNQAPAHEPVILNLDTFSVLQKAKDLYDITSGAFDITIGVLTAHQLDKDSKPYTGRLTSAPLKTGMEYLKLNIADIDAVRLHENIQIDLGAIGKGYALDCMAVHLREWGIHRALLHSGASTVLAMDPVPESRGWPVTISSPWQENMIIAELCLQNCAVSGSAHIDHSHIINPDTGKLVHTTGTWSCCKHAASADALSTALMVMSKQQIDHLCKEYPDFSLAAAKNPNDIVFYGKWPLF